MKEVRLELIQKKHKREKYWNTTGTIVVYQMSAQYKKEKWEIFVQRMQVYY